MKLLDGLRVVEYCVGVVGATCGREFARWGADVLALEPADGSPLREAPPLVERDGRQVSMLGLSLAQDKELERFDAERLASQLSGADVFVTDAPLAELEAAGISRDAIDQRWPRLVVLHCSPFGTDGPYAHYRADDLVMQALAGFAGTQGVVGRPPLAAPAAIIPRAAGVLAAVGGISALLERVHSGRGQWVELSEQEAVSTLIMHVRSEFTKRPIPRTGGPEGWAEVLPTRDGYVTLSPWMRDALRAAPVAFGVEPAPDELAEGEGMVAAKEPSLAYYKPILAERTSAEVFHGLAELSVNLAWVRSAGELLDDPHLAKLGFIRELETAELGTLRTTGPPARLSQAEHGGEQASEQRGEHDGFGRRPRPAQASGPLDGLRVVDFTHAWLGPYATALLADLGAEVIKVEGPRRPDLWRRETRWSMPIAAPDAHLLNIRANFHMANRNKRNVSLALDTDEGRALALELIARADLVLENFRPRVLKNLRLTHAEMRAVNPRVTLVSFSGFGSGGPYSNYRANGGSTEGNAGWDMLLGYPGEAPQLLGTMQADPICGAQMAAVGLAALWRQVNEGGGAVHVEGSMFEAAVGYIEEHALLASAGSGPVARNGNRHPSQAPHECFPCQGEDEWIAISVESDEAWAALLRVAGSNAALDRDEWQTAAGRLADVDALEAAVGEWTQLWDAQTLQARLQRAGVAAGVVHSTLSHLTDPQLEARGWWRFLEHPDTGVRRYGGFPWRFSRTPASVTRPAPRLGEHTVEILTELLGHNEAEIGAWLKAGVIGGLTAQRSPDQAGR